MNRGLFSTQVNTAWLILKHLELDADRVYTPDYSEKASTFRGLNYLNTWKLCVQRQFYNFQLVDNALMQFQVDSYTPLELRYAFYECPFESMSYLDFLASNDFDYYVVGDGFRAEYEDYLATCEIKETFTQPIY